MKDSSWIQTYSGKAFWPLEPDVEDICIEDIAHALSLQCRYAGHTKWHYSVAQHSILISQSVSPENALYGLLHDASEAYLVDIPRPIKHSPLLQSYREAERNLQTCICRKFGLPDQEPEEVRLMDRRILHNERSALLQTSVRDWKLTGEPIPGIEILNWNQRLAESLFLTRFEILSNARH